MEKATKVEHLKRMTERVEKLRDEGRNIGELTVSLSRVYLLIVDPLSGKTSQSNFEEIYGWLEDENVRSIGVYGMGGVGKTTLAKHIYNQMLKNESHVNVYWVTVSQDFNIRKLQDDIIRTVGVTISEENEEQRAAILRNHLVEKNAVLVLDDVWDNIRLEKLGVPLRVKGCKLILTTQSLDVYIWRCTNVKRMPSFLPINDATEQPYIPSSFRKINLFKDDKEWWESLELHNPNAKHILQSHIEWLGPYAYLIFKQEMELSMIGLQNAGKFSLVNFKQCLTLQIGPWHILMRMRAPTEGSCDHIRMAYSCFGIDKLMYTTLEVQRLKVESREEMRERDEARNQIQKWDTLQLQRIPESFLLDMTHLQVLDLSDNPKLECLPNSISNLENLCGLFLQNCEKISCLPAMEKLRALRVLNIEGCKGIRELPQDMECLEGKEAMKLKFLQTFVI
nr:NBS-LRR type disease resistance protein [Ipomoea batatas]